MPRDQLPAVGGRVRGFRISSVFDLKNCFILSSFIPSLAKAWACTDWKSNLVLRSWGGLAGPLLARGDGSYRVNGMYIEFANVASPGDAAPVPAFDRGAASGIPYYNGLAGSPDSDYLRVPLVAATISSTDQELYPDGDLITFFAQTQGSVGVHGKDFGAAANSLVVGGALVARPAVDDPTRDRVLSRFYFEPAEQVPKLVTGQVGLDWEFQLQ